MCVNLYPFERTIARYDVPEEEAIEQIDVGGPTMIRAAAKNHRFVAVVVKPESYDAVLGELEEEGSCRRRHGIGSPMRPSRTPLATTRRSAAGSAAATRRCRSTGSPRGRRSSTSPTARTPISKALYVESGVRSHVLSRVAKLHGKPLSFNNVLDLDSARRLCSELEGAGCVIVKHNNPCGVAEAEASEGAYEAAFARDPTSAFGGVIALNRPVSVELAERLNEQFIEVLIAPGYEDAVRRRCCSGRRASASSRTPSGAPGRAGRQAGARRHPGPGPGRLHPSRAS